MRFASATASWHFGGLGVLGREVFWMGLSLPEVLSAAGSRRQIVTCCVWVRIFFRCSAGLGRPIFRAWLGEPFSCCCRFGFEIVLAFAQRGVPGFWVGFLLT